MKALPRLDVRLRAQRRRELLSSDPTWNDVGSWEASDDWDGAEGDDAGNFQGGWVGIGPAEPLRASLRELAGEEQVIAGKLRGVERCAVTLRADAFTRALTAEDRFRVLDSGRVLNIRHAPPPERGRWIVFTCEAGVTT